MATGTRALTDDLCDITRILSTQELRIVWKSDIDEARNCAKIGISWMEGGIVDAVTVDLSDI